ncbi:O-antigen ligase family protein [Jeotgalibaca sp. MA1X17-3]|uniref:O-antigen ligase family protein n=1 Tax=Jeotgalibaca sp. MA1X17-3 TaxID=2908211 RepID=UPI001F4257EC|nr:O-antigen ligase family protein [Jeotgalibaca sp. MA1X17-3]UJF15391.1 O-antigen ligase family protein [Jeotgalibaca sp. MA1X17-3]
MNVQATDNNRSLIFFISILGIFLNQSNVMFGFNLSLADITIVMILLLLLMNQLLDLPARTFALFFLFSFFLLMNSILHIPGIHQIEIGRKDLLKDYFKLFVSLLYFSVGIQVAKIKLTEHLLKWFLIASTLIGLIGISLFFIRIPSLSDKMLYMGSRLTGFMNDPNYFAVIQCAALAVVLRIKTKQPWLKYASIVILILSIFSSGSKTGFVTLFCLFLIKVIHSVKEGKLKGINLFYILLALSILLLFSPFILQLLLSALDLVAQRFPIFSRVQMLLTDFEQAVSGGGSSRNIQWETGIQLIKTHPITGVGIGQNYLRLAGLITEDANIAHNTFITMAAEWGLPITSVLLIYMGKVFFSPVADKRNEQWSLTVKEMFFTFLIGSMAVSFNYSRIFWLLLGMMVFYSFPVANIRPLRIKDSP